jgi:hypothetical protein
MELGKTTLAMILAGLVAGATAVRGELGAKEDSVEGDRQSLGLDQHVARQGGSYTVHQLASAGLTVWEFAAKDGVIFAFGWQGINPPDLQKLFGAHFARFTAAVRKPKQKPGELPIGAHVRHGNCQETVMDDGVVLERCKTIRQARGLAYLPTAIPAGVTPQDLMAEIQ